MIIGSFFLFHNHIFQSLLAKLFSKSNGFFRIHFCIYKCKNVNDPKVFVLIDYFFQRMVHNCAVHIYATIEQSDKYLN